MFVKFVTRKEILIVYKSPSCSIKTIVWYLEQRLTLEAQGPINAHHGVATGHGNK